MPTIKLSAPWTYCTPLATIDFPAGEHEVTPEIAAAAPTENEIEEDADGQRTAKDRAPRRSRALES